MAHEIAGRSESDSADQKLEIQMRAGAGGLSLKFVEQDFDSGGISMYNLKTEFLPHQETSGFVLRAFNRLDEAQPFYGE